MHTYVHIDPRMGGMRNQPIPHAAIGYPPVPAIQGFQQGYREPFQPPQGPPQFGMCIFQPEAAVYSTPCIPVYPCL